jgi:hypothetical protein
MGNTSSGFVEPFSQCPIDVRVQRSWFARSWRDTSGENSTLRARALTSLPNEFQLIIQESSIALGFGKAYRLVIAPLRDNGKVIVIAPHLTHFQEALSMMMTVYLQSFRLSSPFRCFDDGRECVGSSDTISPVGAWPPAQDRLSLGAQYDGTENENGVIRLLSSDLSCGVGSDADIEVDIVSSTIGHINSCHHDEGSSIDPLAWIRGQPRNLVDTRQRSFSLANLAFT